MVLMAVTADWYHHAFEKAFAKEVDFSVDVLKVALLGSGYTPDLAVDEYWADVSADEITGTGYAAGGEVLGSAAWTLGGGRWRLTGADTVWVTATFTARYAVLYDDSPALPADKPLLGLVDFGEDLSPAGENFTLQWDDTDGLLYIDVL